jgi:hypothetical protein
MLGTTFVYRLLSHIREAFSLTSPPPQAVVNAPGQMGIRLGGMQDEMLYTTRRQAMLVTNTCSKMYARSFSRIERGSDWCYVIPRAFGGGTILGASQQSNDRCFPSFMRILSDNLGMKKSIMNLSMR